MSTDFCNRHERYKLPKMNRLTEQWAVIEDFPNYLISSHGRVKNNTTGKILNGGLNSHGYPQVVLVDNGTGFQRQVHRLVASTFVSGEEFELEVNHIDGNKTNNYFDNLEWITHEQNMRHAVETGLIRKMKRWEVSKDRKSIKEIT